MELVFVALPVALVIAGGVLWAFVWAAKGDQFEDLDTPARRAIFDDLPVRDAERGEAQGEEPRVEPGGASTANRCDRA
ncbi:MAG: cbb3-type cytochrome oxidase assembly protein CcoS [Planctomycetota bacterium]